MSGYYVSSDTSTYIESLRLRRTLGNYPHLTSGNYLNHKKINNIICIHNNDALNYGEINIDYFNVISNYTTENMENCLNEIVYSNSTTPIFSKPPRISVPKYCKNKTIQKNLCMMRTPIRGISSSSLAASRRICDYNKTTTNLTEQETCNSTTQNI